MNYYGSICISDAKESGQIKKAANGKYYINISVRENRDGIDQYGNSHYITCKPKKEEVVEGVKYTIGRLKPSQDTSPSRDDINAAPAANDLNWLN